MKPQAPARRADPFRVIAWAIVAVTTAVLIWLAILTHRDNSSAAEAAEEAVKMEDIRVARYTREWKAVMEDRRIEDNFRREMGWIEDQKRNLERQNELNAAIRSRKEAEQSLRDSQQRLSPNDPYFD